MIRRYLIAAAMAVALSPVAVAHGQTIELGPNGLRVDPPEPIIEVPDRPRPRYEREGISEREAVRIARREGLERVERVRQGRRGWVVAGIDVDGDDIRVIISNGGDVIDVQRE